MRKLLIALATLAAMVVCPYATIGGIITFMMGLGHKYDVNYPYDAQLYGGYPAVTFILVCGVFTYLAPAVIVWSHYRRRLPIQNSAAANKRAAGKLMRKLLIALATLPAMVVCGAAAFVGAAIFLMNLGLKYHNDYEYYGGYPAVILIIACGIVAFLAPAAIVWSRYNREQPWRFSLRTLLLVVALIAIVLGIYAVSR